MRGQAGDREGAKTQSRRETVTKSGSDVIECDGFGDVFCESGKYLHVSCVQKFTTWARQYAIFRLKMTSKKARNCARTLKIEITFFQGAQATMFAGEQDPGTRTGCAPSIFFGTHFVF